MTSNVSISLAIHMELNQGTIDRRWVRIRGRLNRHAKVWANKKGFSRDQGRPNWKVIRHGNSSLRHDDISLTWWNAIGLRVLSFIDVVLNSLFVWPGWILMFYQSFGGWFVLSFRAWHVVTIQNVVNSRHSGWPKGPVSSSNHLIHDRFKLFLDILSFFTEIIISDFSLTTLILKYSLYICNRVLSTSSWW